MITLHWHTEPGLIILLVFFGWFYTLCTLPLRQRIAPGAVFEDWRYACFMTGLVLTYLTVGSPLDQIGEQFLFSAHMIQHELLIYVIPPLLLWGTPGWLADWLLSPRLVLSVWRFLIHPVTAGFLITFAFSIWHIPALYEAALKSKPIHLLEHVTMFFTAMLVWQAFLSPSTRAPRIQHGAQMIYIFLLMIGQLPVFAFLTLSDEVFYPTYEFAPRLEFLPISPMRDQILGGIIMKVCNMIVSLIIFGAAWYGWVKRSEEEAAIQIAGIKRLS